MERRYKTTSIYGIIPQVPTYLTYLLTYHPNLMAPIVRPPDVFLWSWTSSMPFLRFLSGFGEKNGRKVVLEPPDLRTNCACNRHLSLQLVASGLDPLPTYLIMYAGYVFGNYTWVFVVHEGVIEHG